MIDKMLDIMQDQSVDQLTIRIHTRLPYINTTEYNRAWTDARRYDMVLRMDSTEENWLTVTITRNV